MIVWIVVLGIIGLVIGIGGGYLAGSTIDHLPVQVFPKKDEPDCLNACEALMRNKLNAARAFTDWNMLNNDVDFLRKKHNALLVLSLATAAVAVAFWLIPIFGTPLAIAATIVATTAAVAESWALTELLAREARLREAATIRAATERAIHDSIELVRAKCSPREADQCISRPVG